MNFFQSYFLKSTLGALICAAGLSAVALQLDVKEAEVPFADRQACHAFGKAWSKGEEFKHAARLVNTPKTPRPVKLRGFGDFPEDLIDGRWIGQLEVKGGEKFDLIEVQSMGTCYDVNIVLARKIGGREKNAYQAVVRPGTEVNDEFRNSAEGAYNSLRWGSSFGIYEKLFQVNGHLYKASGRFADLRPQSKVVGQANSIGRNLSLLFKRKENTWIPICSFERTGFQFRTRESRPICKALNQGNFDGAESMPNSGFVVWSGAGSDQASLEVQVDRYDSSAGCGAALGWLYAVEEFSGKSREQVLKDGIPKSLSLNNLPSDGSHARGVLEELYERYQGNGNLSDKSTGYVSRWPGFADPNLRFLEVNDDKVILRTAQINPVNKWNYDLEVLQNYKTVAFPTCHGQMLEQVKVKYWYQP